MKAAECSKVAKAMKAAKCSKAMKDLPGTTTRYRIAKAMNAAECSQAAECSKDAKNMKPTKMWKCGVLGRGVLEGRGVLPGHAKFCDDKSVEKDCYAIKDPKEQVETPGATMGPQGTEWEVTILQVFFKNDGRVKIKWIWLETEQ